MSEELKRQIRRRLAAMRGEEYARSVAAECGIADCFAAFLPKPEILVDDQHISEWRRMQCVLPGNLSEKTLDRYWQDVWGLPKGTA